MKEPLGLYLVENYAKQNSLFFIQQVYRNGKEVLQVSNF